MFDIKPYNKMLITKGDAASFTVEVVDLDDKEYEPAETDVLELNVFTDEETLLTKSADFIDGSWVFSFSNSDTKDIAPSVYDYNIVLYSDGEPYTIIDTTAFEVLGTKPGSVEPEPTPEPEPDIDLDPEPEILVPAEGSYVITFGNPVCYAGDNIVVKMRVAPEIAAVDLNLVYDSQHLQMTGYSGGLGNANITYNANSITVNDYATSGESVAEYSFNFKALNTGSAFVRASEIVEITDGNGDPMAEDYVGESSITISQRPSASSEARLSSLTVSAGTWDKEFDPDESDYTITLAEATNELSFTYETMENHATVSYWPYTEAGKIAVSAGENEFHIRSTAQDGITVANYNLIIICPNGGNG